MDVDILTQGFLRESSITVEIGGIRTYGIGGGSVVQENGREVEIGPDSVGYRITKKAIVFGRKTLTATDIAARLGFSEYWGTIKCNCSS